MKNDELHAQMATILELAREDIALKGWSKKHDKILEGVIDDLMFVHKKYDSLFFLKNKKT